MTQEVFGGYRLAGTARTNIWRQLTKPNSGPSLWPPDKSQLEAKPALTLPFRAPSSVRRCQGPAARSSSLLGDMGTEPEAATALNRWTNRPLREISWRSAKPLQAENSTRHIARSWR